MSVPEQSTSEATIAPSNHMNIKEVRRTANDALLSKLSASLRGYFHDDFLQYYAFPILSEYEQLALPNLTQQHARVVQNKTLFDAKSTFQIPDEAPCFQNTPYSPLPSSLSAYPSMNPHAMPQSAAARPFSPTARMPAQTSPSQSQSPTHAPTTTSPPLNLSNLYPNPLIAFQHNANDFTSQLPPSLHPHIPSIVASKMQPRRSPLINKGYACRVHALDKIIVEFVQICQAKNLPSQILSIGAGYDTTYWRLKYHHGIKPTQYIELDFPHTIAHKVNLINHPQNSPLQQVISSYSPSQYNINEHKFGSTEEEQERYAIKQQNMYTTYIHPTAKSIPQTPSPSSSSSVLVPESTESADNAKAPPQAQYVKTATQAASSVDQTYQQTTPFTLAYHDLSLVGCDARDIVSLQTCLEKTLWNPHYPTLALFECVLVYIPPLAANDMLQTLSRLHKNTFMTAVYEQMHPNDPFGRTMMQNLHERGCPLLSLPTYPDLQHQLQRFKNFGFKTFTGWSLAQIAQHFTPCPGVEVLDEMEEYQLMSSHYTVYIALREGEVGKDAPTHDGGAGQAQQQQRKAREEKESVQRTPLSLSSHHLSPSNVLTSHYKACQAANQPTFQASQGVGAQPRTAANVVNNKDVLQCAGDYDWCTSTLTPAEYHYIPNYHPSIKVETQSNDKPGAEQQQQQQQPAQKPLEFSRVGFMGSFPPSYSHNPQVKRHGKQQLID